MKSSFLIFSVILLTVTSCNRTHKEIDQNSSDSTAEKQGTSSGKSAIPVEQPGVYFINLNNGDKVKSPVIFQMGVNGMTVEPAGKVEVGKGHHHIIIDGSYIEKGLMVPSNETHIHFGKGQTSDTLKLSPGQHTLTLQFANGVHDSYGKDWSKTITIEVIK